MRELAVNTFLSLDGVMQAPGGPEEDPSGGFEHGGWSFGYWDEAMQRTMGESMAKPFDLVLGRKTSTGVVMATYRTGAEIKGGSFALEEPSEAELARRAAQDA